MAKNRQFRRTSQNQPGESSEYKFVAKSKDRLKVQAPNAAPSASATARPRLRRYALAVPGPKRPQPPAFKQILSIQSTANPQENATSPLLNASLPPQNYGKKVKASHFPPSTLSPPNTLSRQPQKRFPHPKTSANINASPQPSRASELIVLPRKNAVLPNKNPD